MKHMGFCDLRGHRARLTAASFIGLVLLVFSLIPTVSANEAGRMPEETNYEQDFNTLQRLRFNLIRLAGEIRKREDLFGVRSTNDATLLRPDVRQQIVAIWYQIIDNYLALDLLSEKYASFYAQDEKQQQERYFQMARGIFLTQYRLALEIIEGLEQNAQIDTILNEADTRMGLPDGVYGHFKYQYLNVVKAGHYAAFEAVATLYDSEPEDPLGRWAEEDSQKVLKAGKGHGPLLTVKNGLAIVKQFGHSAWFPVQKEVAQWLGNTKVWRPHIYLIKPEQIETVAGLLEPGDILLERREWYMTNVGIPGFWTHAALYFGSVAERADLSAQPAVRDWLISQGAESIDELIQERYPGAWAGLQIPYKDGNLPRVIEALAPGVSFTSLEYSASCDSLAILRPRLSQADRAAAVVRAMRYYGRPYDYAFDFTSDFSLVCTELIIKSYLPGPSKKGLELPLEEVMGHLITPANAFVRQYDATFGTNEQLMDMVVFLDGDERARKAVKASDTVFRQSWQRPKWHIFVQYAQAHGE